ncbi:MAG: hypothetical protein FWH14_01885 [Oscillospiraceae bacterium]|nr:hypothetical protein [Oscillospiraceae bacterium]
MKKRKYALSAITTDDRGRSSLHALSVTPRRDTSPKGRGKEIHGVCKSHEKNTRRCGGTLFTKEGRGLRL